MKFITSFFLLLCLSLGLSAQKYASGPQVLSFHSLVDGTDQPYAIYIPKNFDEKKSYPFVVMLHGAGSNHRLALRRVFGKSNNKGENDADASLYFPEWEDVPYIVAAPLARGTMGYQGVAESDVWDMIADVKRRFKVDEDRTYLTGLSMGGGGTLWIGLTRPDFWAAIAPVCPAPPEGTAAYLPNAYHIPARFFHGDADPTVPIASVNKWVEDFKKVGAKVEYDVYPGVLHDSWVPAYADGQVFKWFSNFKRNPNPDKVIFSSASLKHNKAFWIELTGLEPGKTGNVEAIAIGNGKFKVKSEGVESFRILPGVAWKNGQKINVEWNGKSINTSVGEEIGTVPSGALRKTSTLTGPMDDISSGRHIYVYGTLDKPSQEELERRRKVAEVAADWSFYRGEFLGRVMVFPRVLPDFALSPKDLENSDLILFGTDKTNKVIADIKDTLPFKFVEGVNMTYIYPRGQKRVLINSGVPFWEVKDKGNPALRILRATSKTVSLMGYGDWTMEKDGDRIWGYFDSQWKVAPSDEGKLKVLGVR
jgi:dienelactone hydrolase